jgi:hypothetical protein
MQIEIKKQKMSNKKTRCNKCRNFLFSTDDSGYLHFREGLSISSNGIEFKIKCSCGEVTKVKLR